MSGMRRNWRSLFEKIAEATANDKWHTSRYPKAAKAKFRRAVIKRVRSCGVPLSIEHGWVFQWDGKKINTGRPKATENEWSFKGTKIQHTQHPSSILHDLAHRAVCPSIRRRKMRDFGLGDGPDSVEELDAVVGYKSMRSEEERASLLGILMEYEMGMPAGETLILHSWDLVEPISEKTWGGVKKVMDRLCRDGLVANDGKVHWKRVAKGVAK